MPINPKLVAGLKFTAVIAAVGLLVLVIVFMVNKLAGSSNPSDTVAQILWMSFSLVILLAVLLAMAVVLGLLPEREGTGALGLPEGSVSAVIAFTLLILFSLSSVYVYTTIRASEETTVRSTGLDIADVRNLPSDRVLQIKKEVGSDPATYTVMLTKPHTTSIEVGRTTLATISTLLVAIVGFYFGQRASEKGLQAGLALEPSTPNGRQAET